MPFNEQRCESLLKLRGDNMRNLLTAFIIGILCMQAHARGTSTSSGDEPLETVVKLSFGTYAGECIGYCVKELNIQMAEG